jgi:uncharacterized membrane protein
MQIALICCYPIFIHLSVVLQEPWYRVPALILLTAGILYKGLLHKNKSAWLTLLAVIVITLAVSRINQWQYAFYLPPIVIPALIAGIFIRSLLPGNEPLVTSIGEKARGPLSTAMRQYTRRVTLVWAIMLVVMTALGIALPVLSSEKIWSLYTNFLSYISIALLFVGEYLYRRVRFKDHNHPGFRQYLNIVLRAGNQIRRP